MCIRDRHKPTTVQGYLAAVKLFFQWTAQEGLYPKVADRVKGAKLDTEHKKDYLTTKQVARLLGAIDPVSYTHLVYQHSGARGDPARGAGASRFTGKASREAARGL